MRPWDIEFTDTKGRGRVALASFGLGILGGASLVAPILLPEATPFAVYFFLLVCFHMAEYLLTAAFRPDTLSFDNFLLNHSLPYQVMTVVCWIEYWAEFFLLGPHSSFLPKAWGPACSVGLALCAVGFGARVLGMATASSNFSHIIEEVRREDHRLVTNGIYAYLRHPAYFGFFWFSVGTQLLLVNPLCLLGYAAASFYFFYDRIPYEEDLLVQFFGEEYLLYRQRTWLGIPFLSWCIRQSVGGARVL